MTKREEYIERLIEDAYQRGHEDGYDEGAENMREMDFSSAYHEGWNAACAHLRASGLLREKKGKKKT